MTVGRCNIITYPDPMSKGNTVMSAFFNTDGFSVLGPITKSIE